MLLVLRATPYGERRKTPICFGRVAGAPRTKAVARPAMFPAHFHVLLLVQNRLQPH